MANNDATKWPYFGKMNVVLFLQNVAYYYDKAEDMKQRQEEEKIKSGILRR